MSFLSRRIGAAGMLLSLLLSTLPAVAADNLYTIQRQWWQWFSGIPAEVHPVVDTTGAYCDLAQRGTYWYLAGNLGGETNRACTVPVGVKLVIPLDNTFCYPEAAVGDTDESCIEYIAAFYDGLDQADFVVKLDNVVQPKADVCEVAAHPADVVQALPAACVIIRRKDRALFSFVVGQAGVYSSPAGVYRANAARGLWTIIDTKPLALGAHVLRITTPFISVRYNLKVAKAKN
ncbi:MAG TPA: hypothetical protein VJL86_13315 [Steroidobacteraceae bacterium]|nr:hypothetical protein [Steroidobacteraceae bacterium]